MTTVSSSSKTALSTMSAFFLSSCVWICFIVQWNLINVNGIYFGFQTNGANGGTTNSVVMTLWWNSTQYQCTTTPDRTNGGRLLYNSVGNTQDHILYHSMII